MKSSIYHGENNIDIEYIFQKESSSDVLIVSFPGAVVEAGGQGWGWLLTLKEFHTNVICVHSNPNYNKSRLTYHNGKPVIYDAVMTVINKLVAENQINRIIAVGTSMGAYAAMFYGLKNGWYIIAGTPPYTMHDNNENILYAAGNVGPKAKTWANKLMENLIICELENLGNLNENWQSSVLR